MFRGNTKVLIERVAGYDAYGKPEFKRIPLEPVSGSIVALKAYKTPSQSGSDAYEESDLSVILVAPNVDVKIGDKLTVRGRQLEVKFIHERFDVRGNHHHNQVECITWG